MDIGAALLGDAEHLLDHAAEQKATTLALAKIPNGPSPSWMLVTIYYWAFFSAVAITRLIGRTVWFLDKTSLNGFVQASSGSTIVPGGGAFALVLDAPVSANDRLVVLTQTKSRLHEAVWGKFFDGLQSAVVKAPSRQANIQEYELYMVLLDTFRRVGRDWPSAVRNAVNYRPGLAYDAVRGTDVLGFAKVARATPPQTLQSIVDAHRSALAELGRPVRQVDDAPALYARLLVSMAFVLDAIAVDLHADLMDRNLLVKEWQKLRSKYLVRHGIGSGAASWPLIRG